MDKSAVFFLNKYINNIDATDEQKVEAIKTLALIEIADQLKLIYEVI
jgi:hypothetical protein